MSGDLFAEKLRYNNCREDMARIHVESFNALFDTSNNPGLLTLMINNIDKVDLGICFQIFMCHIFAMGFLSISTSTRKFNFEINENIFWIFNTRWFVVLVDFDKYFQAEFSRPRNFPHTGENFPPWRIQNFEILLRKTWTMILCLKNIQKLHNQWKNKTVHTRKNIPCGAIREICHSFYLKISKICAFFKTTSPLAKNKFRGLEFRIAL